MRPSCYPPGNHGPLRACAPGLREVRPATTCTADPSQCRHTGLEPATWAPNRVCKGHATGQESCWQHLVQISYLGEKVPVDSNSKWLMLLDASVKEHIYTGPSVVQTSGRPDYNRSQTVTLFVVGQRYH